jgi:hypothetical protein
VKFTVAVTEAVSPWATVAELALNESVEVAALKIALEGPVDRTPNPNAATNASAMRLNDVDLLVICFLSKVVLETFPNTAGKELPLPRDAMHVLLHHILRRVSGRGEEI